MTQANNGAPPGSVSSYQILANGTAEAITNTLVTGTQLAPCWNAITANRQVRLHREHRVGDHHRNWSSIPIRER